MTNLFKVMVKFPSLLTVNVNDEKESGKSLRKKIFYDV